MQYRCGFQEAFERPGGMVSGHVYMAAADVAMWLAIKTRPGLADADLRSGRVRGPKTAGCSRTTLLHTSAPTNLRPARKGVNYEIQICFAFL